MSTNVFVVGYALADTALASKREPDIIHALEHGHLGGPTVQVLQRVWVVRSRLDQQEVTAKLAELFRVMPRDQYFVVRVHEPEDFTGSALSPTTVGSLWTLQL